MMLFLHNEVYLDIFDLEFYEIENSFLTSFQKTKKYIKIYNYPPKISEININFFLKPIYSNVFIK